MLQVIESDSDTADVGDTWRSLLFVTNADGVGAAPDTIGGTVTKPDLTTAAMTVTAKSITGLYEVSHILATAGRYTAAVSITSALFGPDAAQLAITALAGGVALPVLADLQAYLGASAASWTNPELQAVLDTELAAQRDVCRVPSAYPKTLQRAVLRRCARSLALQGMPLAVLPGDAESGPLVLPRNDPEVRRWEAPYRKLTVG